LLKLYELRFQAADKRSPISLTAHNFCCIRQSYIQHKPRPLGEGKRRGGEPSI
jgi:hypothetical protein